VAYPRLLSELFYQCSLIERLKEIQDPEVIRTVRSSFFTAGVLVNMHKLKKKDPVYPNRPLTRNMNPDPSTQMSTVYTRMNLWKLFLNICV
jgi:hypothetical protein